jgi:NAD(P)-dependent dehydrogenase (short-subunit alcohol dehydrogenase family)
LRLERFCIQNAIASMSPQAGVLQGQTALVTGAARGLGYATARRLGEEGARVALLDRDGDSLSAAAEELARDGLDVSAFAADVTDENAVRSVAAELLAGHGRIDVLVNNAGIYPHRPFEELTFAEWRHVLAVNLDGVYICARAVYPAMRERGYGRIVNVSSATFFIGYPGLTAYVASKGGIIGFTRALASEAGPHGITVNAVTPGLVATEGVLEGEEAGLFDEIVPEQAVPRRGEPEDIAACIAYLASPAAGFITGQTVNVDGGHRYH